MGLSQTLSKALLDLKFFWVLGTTQTCGDNSGFVQKGRPFTWDYNNGVVVVYDEEGRPWIERTSRVFDKSRILEPFGFENETFKLMKDKFNLSRGAHVPHSNDGGAWASEFLH